MASNARIEFPDIIDIGNPHDQPAGPASFNPGPVGNAPMRNVPPRTTRLRQKEDSLGQQPNAFNGPSSPQQVRRGGNDNFYGSSSKSRDMLI